jgi:hypothetical protein
LPAGVAVKAINSATVTVNKYLEGLSDLFSKGKKITFSIEFVYKEVTSDSTIAKGKKKKKSAIEAQKL